MLKTIPFNLEIDGRQIRSLEGLRSAFHIHDVLAYYHSGLLAKWLHVRGHEDLGRAVSELKGSTEMEHATALVNVLEVPVPQAQLARELHVLAFEQERRQELQYVDKARMDREVVISLYHQGYSTLLRRMLEGKDDFAFLKAASQDLHKEFYSLFELDFRRLFYQFSQEAPLAIFALLMHKQLRAVFLLDEDVQGRLKTFYRAPEVLEKVKEHLKSFNGKTDSYWKVIQPTDREYLIVSMENGNFIRDGGAGNTQLSGDNVNGKYLLLKGIDYMSNNESHKLLYMEV